MLLLQSFNTTDLSIFGHGWRDCASSAEALQICPEWLALDPADLAEFALDIASCRPAGESTPQTACSASGKSAERPVLSVSEIEQNVKGIEAILQRLLSNAAASNGASAHQHPAVVLNNLVRSPPCLVSTEPALE